VDAVAQRHRDRCNPGHRMFGPVTITRVTDPANAAHHVIQRDRFVRIKLVIVGISIDFVDLTVAHPAHQRHSGRRIQHQPHLAGIGRALVRMIRQAHRHILDEQVVLCRQYDRFLGLAKQLVDQPVITATESDMAVQPASERGDLQGRQIGSRLAIIVEVALDHHALEQVGRARLRISERRIDFVEPQWLAPIAEQFEHFEGTRGRFDGFSLHLSIPTTRRRYRLERSV